MERLILFYLVFISIENTYMRKIYSFLVLILLNMNSFCTENIAVIVSRFCLFFSILIDIFFFSSNFCYYLSTVSFSHCEKKRFHFVFLLPFSFNILKLHFISSHRGILFVFYAKRTRKLLKRMEKKMIKSQKAK